MNRRNWHSALIDDALDDVTRMIADGQLLDHRDRYGQTPLMLAATYGRAEVVELLLDRGAELDKTAKYGLSALMLAAVNGNTGVAESIIAAGADPSLEGTGAPGFAGKHAGDLARAGGHEKLADAIALDLIARAFDGTPRASTMSDSKQLSDVEHEEVMAFAKMPWEEITFDLIERGSDSIFWFSPDAFHYCLPGILSAGIREHRWDANCYDALIGMLDRSPEPTSWDEFFEPRWTRLTRPQLRATATWVDWLESVLPDGFHDNTYDRARETLALLARVRTLDAG